MFNSLSDLFITPVAQWVNDTISDFLDFASLYGIVPTSVDELSNIYGWPMLVPWHIIIAAVVLCVFIVCFFKLVRSILCKIF